MPNVTGEYPVGRRGHDEIRVPILEFTYWKKRRIHLRRFGTGLVRGDRALIEQGLRAWFFCWHTKVGKIHNN